jgi:hypothetical protein
MWIERPVWVGSMQEARLVDRRSHHPGQRWRFWGGLLMALSVASFLFVPSLRRFDDLGEVALALGTAAVGAGVMLFAGKPTVREVELALVEPDEGWMEIRPAASSVLPQGRALRFEEVRHVVFGMTRHPMELERPQIKVEAFTVCLELHDGAVLPVVEACPEKLTAYQVATFLSQTLRAPLLQAGLGA